MADTLRVELRQEGPIPLDVSLACDPGEVLAIVGPSGSGKSTILRAVAGLYRPKEGRVASGATTWFDAGADVWLPPHRRRVGLVFQNYALFPHLTALRNVVASLGHLPRRERTARAEALLAMVHLEGLEARRPAELSGGQQQRVAVARALARDPEALLLDEPFSAVDRTNRQRLHRELAQLRRTLAMPILLVTHDFDEAAWLADRMCLLDGGHVVQEGPPGEVLARPASVEAARLVDLRNMSHARVSAQDPDRGRTWLDWHGVPLAARHHPRPPVGAAVTWAVPSNQVVIRHPDATTSTPNLLACTVEEVAGLSEGTRAVLAIDAVPGARLSVMVPADYTQCNGLRAGAAVTVEIPPDAIHVIEGIADGEVRTT
jgi:molybdate transport system ATP-binding protein